MTERLYFHDANLLEFDATVQGVVPHERGFAVVLDRTAFYPEGGGQPADTGTLGDARIVDVQEDARGILHVGEGVAPAVGARVAGMVDAQRRQDHREQHSGQHLLTRAFIRVAGANTLSFHLGPDAATIDLDQPALSERQLEAVEDETARVIRDDRPVTTALYVDAADRPANLRKIPVVDGAFRVITIDDYDVCACGGTHVNRTGEIASIALLRTEKLSGDRLRVTFVCGDRARADHRSKVRLLRELVQKLSVGEGDVAAAVTSRLARIAELDKVRKDLERELVPARVDRLVAGATRVGTVAVVVAEIPSAEREGVQDLARGCSARAGVVAALVCGGDRPQIAVGVGDGVPLAAGDLVKSAIGPIGGKGGGTPRLAFGGFPAGIDPTTVAAAARDAISSALSP